MKAALLAAYGDTDQFSYGDAPTPAPGAGEVLVRVEASGFNPVDAYVRQGYLAANFPLPMPAILGMDLAGTIDALGAGVTGYKVGDRVIAKQPIGVQGAHAEFAAVKTEHLAFLPDNVSFSAAATLPLVGLTARQAVNLLGDVKDQRVLVTGALGGVGRATLQYLTELGAIPVAGVRGSREAEARALGVEAMDIDAPEIGAPFDAAVSNIAGPTTATAVSLVKDGGILAAVVGLPDGVNADNRITIANVWTTENQAILQAVADAAGRGELMIPIARTFTLAQLADGHKLAAEGRVGGRIVFVP